MKLNLTSDEVDKLVEGATFADMLVLAENFWDLPHATRLLVLAKTTVDPFVVHNQFTRFFWAFGFGDYFAKFADEKDLELRAVLVKGEFQSLLARMERELREIVEFQRDTCTVSLRDSFCKNVSSMQFTSPPALPGYYEDYKEVQREVGFMATKLKYPQVAAMFDDHGNPPVVAEILPLVVRRSVIEGSPHGTCVGSGPKGLASGPDASRPRSGGSFSDDLKKLLCGDQFIVVETNRLASGVSELAIGAEAE